MNILRKTFILAVGMLFTITAFGYFLWGSTNLNFHVVDSTISFAATEISKTETMNRLKIKALTAKNYAIEHGYDASHCFLIDMRIPSGKNRFFVYNLEEDSVETAGLVTHGKGSENELGSLIFSNTPNSNCTSLGKYKIGRSYQGNFGLSYKLMGLDKTNSKAFGRSVVLHSYCGVPKDEVYPNLICLSEGCPAVSPAFFTQLKTYMDESKEPILLWIYY
ncbi:MAG: murein L,D-transpeptidase catalytic domain-containing protein [Ferruginibacter sp.]